MDVLRFEITEDLVTWITPEYHWTFREGRQLVGTHIAVLIEKGTELHRELTMAEVTGRIIEVLNVPAFEFHVTHLENYGDCELVILNSANQRRRSEKDRRDIQRRALATLSLLRGQSEESE